MLVDDLRRKLLSGELRLKDIIDNQESMAEFKISLPPDLPIDDDSDSEDMRERRRAVTLKKDVVGNEDCGPRFGRTVGSSLGSSSGTYRE